MFKQIKQLIILQKISILINRKGQNGPFYQDVFFDCIQFLYLYVYNNKKLRQKGQNYHLFLLEGDLFKLADSLDCWSYYPESCSYLFFAFSCLGLVFGTPYGLTSPEPQPVPQQKILKARIIYKKKSRTKTIPIAKKSISQSPIYDEAYLNIKKLVKKAASPKPQSILSRIGYLNYPFHKQIKGQRIRLIITQCRYIQERK